MNKLYAVQFCPVEQYAAYQEITPEQASALMLAWQPEELPEFFKRVYVVDSEEWLCVSESLEQAQMALFARWVLCLYGRFEDGLDWFGEGDDPKKVLQTAITYWTSRAKVLLFFDMKPDNIVEQLID